MSFINKYLRNFKPYKLASHKVWLVNQEERNKILKLDWNEATIMPSPSVKEKILNFINNNDFFNLYPATYNDELITKLAEYVHLSKDNVQYFASSDSLHEYIAKMYISVGDPILILGPSYDNFRLTAEVNGANVFFFETDEDFNIDYEGFEKTIERISPSLVYICNPNNPTGNLHSIEYIDYLLNKYQEIMFLIDEAYYEFAGKTAASLVNKYENILISRTMSKAFALANFRFGYLISSKKNISYISSIRNPKNITTFSQIAAIAALSDLEYMHNYVNEVLLAREYFYNEMMKFDRFLHVYQSSGNFILIKCCSYDFKLKILDYLEKNNIFIRNVNQSKILINCVRISIGLKFQMERVVNTISNFIEEYKNEINVD